MQIVLCKKMRSYDFFAYSSSDFDKGFILDRVFSDSNVTYEFL